MGTSNMTSQKCSLHIQEHKAIAVIAHFILCLEFQSCNLSKQDKIITDLIWDSPKLDLTFFVMTQPMMPITKDNKLNLGEPRATSQNAWRGAGLLLHTRLLIFRMPHPTPSTSSVRPRKRQICNSDLKCWGKKIGGKSG